MADLILYCLVDGESTSSAFPVEIAAVMTVGQLKKVIMAKNVNHFSDVDAKDLTLWKVSIPSTPARQITLSGLNEIDDKTELFVTDELSEHFKKKTLRKKGIHIIVGRPPQDRDPEVAALRKQLSDMRDSSIKLSIVVKPYNAVFTWFTEVETATLKDLKKAIADEYSQYANDDYLEIYVHDGRAKVARLCDDHHLRNVLRVAKSSSKTKLTLSLQTPAKNFSAWTFKDVCEEYQLSLSAEIDVIPHFEDIKAASLKSDLEMQMLTQLTDDIESMVHVLRLIGANEATMSMIVGSFLVKVTRLFKDDLYLAAKRYLSGRRGHGPVDFSVHSKVDFDITLCVTEVKKEDIRQGVAQNIVQLEAALTSKKRKRGPGDVNGEEVSMEMRSYGIVTDASQWLLIECTIHEDETVSYRKSMLGRTITYGGDCWKLDTKFIFERLVWLWARMKHEITDRDSKLVVSPSKRQAVETTDSSASTSTAASPQ